MRGTLKSNNKRIHTKRHKKHVKRNRVNKRRTFRKVLSGGNTSGATSKSDTSRILVFMSDNRKLESSLSKAEYNSVAAAINYEYCKKHGYDFLFYRPYLNNKEETPLLNNKNPITNTLRHAAWSKLLSTEYALNLGYDYICYIDSDCIFKDFDQTIEDFIKPYSDKEVLFLNNKPWGDDLPCSGFYISKVTDRSKKFFKDWYNTNIPANDTERLWEQPALHDVFRDHNYIGVIDSWMFEEKEKQFLRHVASNDRTNTLPYFKNFLKTKGINFEQNISEIKVIEFDTDKARVEG